MYTYFIKKCTICEEKFNSWDKLKDHYTNNHNLDIFYNICDFKVKYKNFIRFNKEIPKCKYCNQNDIVCKSGRLTDHCDNEECCHLSKSKLQKEIHKNNPQLAINARKRRIEYLSNKENFNSTAFGKRANKQLSFLEKWFYNKIVQKYDLTKKYLIINEYKITNENMTSAYSLDFAFINIKLDVELDGRCHFKNGNERINTDIKRDNYLLNSGWNIYRISYYDIEYNEKETINKFIKLLENNDFDYDKSYYLKNKVITNNEFKKQYEIHKNKEYQKEQRNIRKLQDIKNKRNILIDLEKNSNIDFSKFGWVNKAHKFLQTKNSDIKMIHRYINKYYPEFFKNNNVFIKNFNKK